MLVKILRKLTQPTQEEFTYWFVPRIQNPKGGPKKKKQKERQKTLLKNPSSPPKKKSLTGPFQESKADPKKKKQKERQKTFLKKQTTKKESPIRFPESKKSHS